MIIPPDDDRLTAPRSLSWLRLAMVDLTPLRRHRDFRLLFMGRGISFLGSMISVVAFPYQVYQLTHSTLLAGALGVIEFIASGPALGNFEAGLIASIFSVRVSVVSGGVLCVVGCAVCELALPLFRAYDADEYHLAPDPAGRDVMRKEE